MMRKRLFIQPAIAVLTLVLLFGLASVTQAREFPSFSLSDLAWNATTIVLVDDRGWVQETWKGQAYQDQY